MEKFCPSHEHLVHSSIRQEKILEEFRIEASNHREKMSAMMAEVCSKLQTISEIKTTQIDNMRRREDFSHGCEENRKEIWEEINAIKSRQDKKDGSMVLLAGVCTSIGAAVAWLLTWLQKHV